MSFFVFADEHRCSAELISGGQERSVFFHDQDRRGTFDRVLRELDTADEVALLIDHGCQNFCGVDPSSAHLFEVTAAEGQVLFDQRIQIVDPAYEDDRVGSQVGMDEQRLRICIADASYSCDAAQAADNIFEFRSERRVFNVVDLPFETSLRIIDGNAAPACAQM